MKNIVYRRRNGDMICYSKLTGKPISPYDDCPICNTIYKDCPHMSMGVGVRVALQAKRTSCKKKVIPPKLVRSIADYDEMIEVRMI